MASIDIKLALKLQEMNTVVAALQQWRKIQAFNINGIATAKEEKTAAMQEFLRVEGILRQFGIEPEELNNTEEGKPGGSD